METYFRKIADLTQTIHEESSPLQREIGNMTKYDFIIAVVVGSVFFLTRALLRKNQAV